VGRGKATAAWSYYSSTAYILGIRPETDGLRIDPCLPGDWPGYTATRRFRGMLVHIEVKNLHGVQRGVGPLSVNGEPLEGNLVPLAKLSDGARIVVEMR